MAIIIGKPLVTKKFTKEDFKDNPSVLRERVSIEDLEYRVRKQLEKNRKKRSPKRLVRAPKKF